MATKKKNKKKAAKSSAVVRQGDKAAYVRKLPRSMPASEVVEKCAVKGMVVSKAYIHNIRSAANKVARKLEKETKKKAIVTGNQARKERAFRELVIDMGPARAKKLLQQCETALAVHT